MLTLEIKCNSTSDLLQPSFMIQKWIKSVMWLNVTMVTPGPIYSNVTAGLNLTRIELLLVGKLKNRIIRLYL